MRMSVDKIYYDYATSEKIAQSLFRTQYFLKTKEKMKKTKNY